MFLDAIRQAGTVVERPWTVVGFRKDGGGDEVYPVEVGLKNNDANVVETVRNMYRMDSSTIRSDTYDKFHLPAEIQRQY